MGVTTGDNEREQREFHGSFGALAGFHQDGVDVAFEMIDADQRLVEAEAKSFGIRDANEQRPGKPRAFRDGDGVEIGIGDARLQHGFADHRHDVAEMLAGGQLGDDATIVGVERHLRGDDVRQRGTACANHRGGSLVAGAFDAENQAAWLLLAHLSILRGNVPLLPRAPVHANHRELHYWRLDFLLSFFCWEIRDGASRHGRPEVCPGRTSGQVVDCICPFYRKLFPDSWRAWHRTLSLSHCRSLDWETWLTST